MKAAGYMILAGYAVLLMVIGPWGLAAVAAHLGLMVCGTINSRKGG